MGLSDLVYLARVRYNVMLSEGENDTASDAWESLSSELDRRTKVDLLAVFSELKLQNPATFYFLSNIQKAFKEKDIDRADVLIGRRERELKGINRAKLSRTKEFDHSKWVGGGKLDYRFSNARRIVNDIYAGEERVNV